jgi:hypothetical protein
VKNSTSPCHHRGDLVGQWGFVIGKRVHRVAGRERLDDLHPQRVVGLGVAVRRQRDGDHDGVRQQPRRGAGGADQADR